MMILKEALALYPNATSYTPAEHLPRLNAEILALMRSGAKTATCALPSEFTEDEPMPEVGRVDIACDVEGRPVVATRTLSVEQLKFHEMDEARVPAQGEFRDLAHWRVGYTEYYNRLGVFAPDMDLIYERFEIVRDFVEGSRDV